MICQVTSKDFKLDRQEEKVLQRKLLALKKRLENFSTGVVKLSIVMKFHEKKNFFSGDFTLLLPKKPLIAKSGGNTAEELLMGGFDTLESQFQVYKAKNFIGSSEHPHRDRIVDAL